MINTSYGKGLSIISNDSVFLDSDISIGQDDKKPSFSLTMEKEKNTVMVYLNNSSNEGNISIIIYYSHSTDDVVIFHRNYDAIGKAKKPVNFNIRSNLDFTIKNSPIQLNNGWNSFKLEKGSWGKYID